MRSCRGEELPLSYWLSLVRADARRHFRRRLNPAAFVRSVWGTLAHRDNVERCADCGRVYPTWVSNGDLYERITGTRGSQFCPGCLSRRADARGVHLVWVPEVCHEDGEGPRDMDRFNAICDRIGAFG